MARADRRQAARQARQVQRRPRAAGGGTQIAEDTMFFPRLRNHAKWVFVFLIVVFAGGFVFLGVGSGSAGLGDVLQGNWSDIFSSNSTNSATIRKDQKLIKDNPKNYEAYRELASAQAADGKVDAAIVTLQRLKSVNPKDVDGLSLLASMFIRKADEARLGAQVAQAKAQTVVPQSTFAPAPTTDIGKAYQAFSAPVANVLEGKVNEEFQTAYSKMTSAYGQAVTAYKEVAKANPNDASTQVALGQTAENAGDTTTAIAAYKQFLKLAPDDSLAPAVKQRIKSLQSQPTATTTG